MPKHLRHLLLRGLLALVIVLAASRPPDPAWAVEEQISAPPSASELKLDALLGELTDVIRTAETPTKAQPEYGFAPIEKLKELTQKIRSEDEKNHTYFNQLERFLIQKRMPDEIVKRHRDFVASYDTKYRTLNASLNEIHFAHQTATGFWGWLTGANKRVNWPDVLGRATTFLQANTSAPPTSNFDPKNLPHRNLKADNTISPKLTADEWRQAYPPQPVGSKLAKGSEYPAASPIPTPEDLTETIEIRFTPAITQLAAQLDHNPAKIYNWVRNNIEFVPTWGSIQGAQMCLDTKVCNAFDTSSLLIALLRTSGIPARYQMGTIEVPMSQFMNWVGGFTDALASAEYVAAAGTPEVTVQIPGNSSPRAVRLEHIWVNAYVDYAASHGSINVRGDTWIPMDPSFKQFRYTRAIDPNIAVNIDSGRFFQQIQDGSIVDAQIGSATLINSDVVSATLIDLSQQFDTFIRSNMPNVPFRDIHGTRRIIEVSRQLLATSLPYRVLISAVTFSSIPSSLQHRLTFVVDKVTANSELEDIRYVTNLASLTGKKITLGYYPVTSSDTDILASLLPVNVGDPWPNYVPTFLVNVRPILKIDGVPVATGSASSFGAPHKLQMLFHLPGGQTQSVINEIEAGEFYVVGLDLQQISLSQLQRSIDDLRTLNQVLGGTANVIPNGDELRTTPFFAAISTWFLLVDNMKQTTYEAANIAATRYPSAGLFFADIYVQTFFGVPRSASSNGLVMDIDRNLSVSRARDGDTEREISTRFLQGALASALESRVPKSLFSDPNRPGVALAATNVIAIANDTGIPVYRIDQSNIASVLPRLEIGDLDRSDIQDAINAKLVVVIPQRGIPVLNERVTGYAILDPDTGAGDYIISRSSGRSFGGSIVTAISEYLGAISGAVLGVITGRDDIPFYDRLVTQEFRDYIRRIGRFATILDVVAVLSQIVVVLTTPGLTVYQIVGQISTIVATAGLQILVAGMIFSYFLNPFTGIVIGAVATIALAEIGDEVSHRLFGV